MKKLLSILLCIAFVFSFASCSSKIRNDGETINPETETETTTTTTEPTTEDPNIARLAAARGKEEGTFYSDVIAVPDEYFRKTENGRPTELLTYTYKDYTKSCVVYTPPGYDESNQYNVYYLAGGIMADETAFFNEAGAGSTLQNMFDHMIEAGEVEPFIAVNVCFFYTKGDHNLELDNGKATETVEMFMDELRTAIVPAVESKYATFAEGTDEVDFIASRKHRCFGGFSLGSSLSFRTLTDNLDYFYYFAPLCGADFQTYYPEAFDTTLEDDLRAELAKLDYDTDDYFIYCTEGGNDNTFEDMDPLMNRILEEDDLFIRTDNDKSLGNIAYKIMPGWAAQHRYIHAYRYYYNSLLAFWGKELTREVTTEVTMLQE